MKKSSAISAGHEATMNMAKEILKMGGNAFDAAVSAHLTMYISEPCMASAGAGGFALCYTPQRGVQMLDFFAQTPSQKNLDRDIDFYPIEVNFGNETEEFHVGSASMAVPGSLAGLFEMHDKLGSLPMDVLIDPVIDLAKNGVPVDKFQAIDMGLLKPILYNDESVRDIFFQEGKLKAEGEVIYMPNFIDFLDFIKVENHYGFYKGEIGQKIGDYAQDHGGFLTRQDFENYQAIWKKPLSTKVRGFDLYVPNASSIGGAIMMILRKEQLLNNNNDLKSIENTLAACKNLKNIDSVIKKYYPNTNFKRSSFTNSTKGTSHFNILDKWGNAVALTCSLGEGAGYFIPGTDMQMNNMLGESFLLPDGFHSWQPNVRLNSMMTPTMAIDSDRRPRFIGGSGGAGRIPYMISQVLDRYFNEGLYLEEAIYAPRLYVHNDTVHFESGYEIDKKNLAHREFKEWTGDSLFFGGVHAIAVDERGGVEAIGDQRRFGSAIIV